jgi:hypothetical protein
MTSNAQACGVESTYLENTSHEMSSVRATISHDSAWPTECAHLVDEQHQFLHGASAYGWKKISHPAAGRMADRVRQAIARQAFLGAAFCPK